MRRLRKKKVHQSLTEELFNRLKRLELLDDLKFAQWWIGQRMQFRPKSKRELVYELRMKGIGKETIEKALVAEDVNDVVTVGKLLKIKSKEYLLRHGFDWETVKRVQ